MRRVGIGLASVGLLATAGVVPALADGTTQTAMVTATPSANTPNVCNGKVNTFAQVGNTIIAGGKFTEVRPPGQQCSSTSAGIARSNIFAFDATTGAISNSFAPNVNGEVWEVLATGDGTSVYVGGAFSQVAGQSAYGKLARLNVASGAVITSFSAPTFNGKVLEIALANGKLYVGGAFTKAAGLTRTALAAVNPSTGALDGSVNLPVTGVWGGGKTNVSHFSITPDGSRLLAIGNFTSVGGQSRAQIARLALSATTTTVDDWSTQRFATTCAGVFDTYMRGVDISPDGAYAIVTTTGGYAGGPAAGTLCDSVSRWEMAASGGNQQPSWVDYTGGDTFYAAEATGAAVYVGGHFRWLNNPSGNDTPGPGAVAREGIAALDPRNGLPLSWNPGRARGVGVFDLMATSTGLYAGSDTTRFGGQYRGRIAFTPLGAALPADATGTLPGTVVGLGKPGTTSGVLYRVNAGGPALSSTDGGPDWSADTSSSTLHNNVSTPASYPGVTIGRDSTVPAGAPQGLYTTERWDPPAAPEMQWDFPVQAGVQLQVRLYFADSYEGTNDPGERVFNVSIDGTTVLNNFSIVTQAGWRTATMRSFSITSDGNVDIDFAHVVENPLINAIEIVRTDVSGGDPSQLDNVDRRAFTGTAVTALTTTSGGGVAWRNARGAVMIDTTLYTAWSDGTFDARSYNGTTFGAASQVNLNGLTAFATEAQTMTGMFFDPVRGRLYFTLAGQNTLYYRYFTPETRTVGAQRFTAATGSASLDYASVRGAFLVGNTLYLGSPTGDLRAVDWQGTQPLASSLRTVSGPSRDGQNWSARALFLSVG